MSAQRTKEIMEVGDQALWLFHGGEVSVGVVFAPHADVRVSQCGPLPRRLEDVARSCVHHIRNKFTAAEDTPERRQVSSQVWDLPEFLWDVLQVREFPWAEFPHEVALHVSGSAIRGLYEQSHAVPDADLVHSS